MFQRLTPSPRLFLAAILAVSLLALGCMKSPEEKYADYMASGLQYAEDGDWASALIEFKNAARTDAEQAEPYYQMALAEMATGAMQDAVNSVQRAVSLDPDHVDANLLLARFMVRLGNPEILPQAEEILTAVLGETRDNSDALFVLAATRARMGADEEASSLLEEALANSPDHLKSSIALAKLKLNQGDRAGAEEILLEAVQRAQEKNQALIALGQFYMGSNQPEKARERFQAILDEDAEYAPALLGLGMLHLRGGEKEAAEAIYQRLSKLDNKNYKPLYGQILAVNGKIDEAVAEYRRVLADDPGNRDVRKRLVATFLSHDRLTEAEAILTEALEASPNDTDARLQRAELYRRYGRLEEAEEDLGRVLEFRPDSAEAHFFMARINRERAQPRLQRQELDEALRIDPSYLPARLDLARSMLQSATPRGALEILDEAPPEQANSAPLVAARNWALIALGENDEARRNITAALDSGAASAEFLVQEAAVKMAENDYNGAIASAEKALEQAPTDMRAMNVITASYDKLGQAPKGVARLAKQAEIYPKSVTLQLALAAWYERVKNPAAAREVYQKALDLGDRNGAAATRLAMYDFAEGNAEGATSKLLNTIDENPSSIAALLTLAQIQEQTNKKSEAMASYRKVLTIRPDYYPALNNLAYLLAVHEKQLDEALGFAQKAKELAPPNNAEVDDTIGWVFYLKGVYPTAVVHLRDAAENQPSNPVIHYHLAMAQAKSGNAAAGREAYNVGLKLDSSLPEAEQAKQVVEAAE